MLRVTSSSGTASRSTRVTRAADPSGAPILIVKSAISRLRLLASTLNSRPNNIASRYARSLTDDRFPLSRQEHVARLARVGCDRLVGHLGHLGGLCERLDETLQPL